MPLGCGAVTRFVICERLSGQSGHTAGAPERSSCAVSVTDGSGFIVHLHEFRCVTRLVRRPSDNHCDRVADITHVLARQARVRRIIQRRSVGSFARQIDPHGSETIGRKICLGEHGEYAVCKACRLRVDSRDAGMRMRLRSIQHVPGQEGSHR